MSALYKNPLGVYLIEVENKKYTVDTNKPDFIMSYREQHQTKRSVRFCVLDKAERPMPNTPNKKGYLCVSICDIQHRDKFPIWVVRKERINYNQFGDKHSQVEYIYEPLNGKYDKNQGKIIKCIEEAKHIA